MHNKDETDVWFHFVETQKHITSVSLTLDNSNKKDYNQWAGIELSQNIQEHLIEFDRSNGIHAKADRLNSYNNGSTHLIWTIPSVIWSDVTKKDFTYFYSNTNVSMWIHRQTVYF